MILSDLTDALRTRQFVQDLQGVLAHELPDEGEDELLVAIDDVQATDVNERELEGFADVYRVVGILDLLETGLGFEVGTFPVDTAWLHLILNTQKVVAILQVDEQVVNVDTVDVQRVDPHAEDTFLAAITYEDKFRQGVRRPLR